MAISPNHYHRMDLRNHLNALGLSDEADQLRKLEDAIDEARKECNDAHNAALAFHRAALDPLLRPCHRKQGLDLRVTGGH